MLARIFLFYFLKYKYKNAKCVYKRETANNLTPVSPIGMEYPMPQHNNIKIWK